MDTFFTVPKWRQNTLASILTLESEKAICVNTTYNVSVTLQYYISCKMQVYYFLPKCIVIHSNTIYHYCFCGQWNCLEIWCIFFAASLTSIVFPEHRSSRTQQVWLPLYVQWPWCHLPGTYFQKPFHSLLKGSYFAAHQELLKWMLLYSSLMEWSTLLYAFITYQTLCKCMHCT